ncbi:MAG TPA: PfkB family carbohydrate kinase [Patescibacteria group bacterium]|nr:PfkB family carbohydrate kinase [Patescibacteria group bacterium]
MRLLLIGAITNSEAKYKDGIHKRFGGGVMYGAKAALKLRINTTVITIGAGDISGGIDELSKLGAKVMHIKRSSSNNFANDYTREKRILYLSSMIDKPIMSSDLTIKPTDFDMILLNPILNEISKDLIEMFDQNKIILDLQGFTRKEGRKNRSGLRTVLQKDWDDKGQMSNSIEILKMSDVDLANISFPENIKSSEEKCLFFARLGYKNIVLTRGDNSIIIVDKNKKIRHIPTVKVKVVDPAGAGDVFGVAFSYEYHRTHDVYKSARFANICTALKISGEDYNVDKIESLIKN